MSMRPPVQLAVSFAVIAAGLASAAIASPLAEAPAVFLAGYVAAGLAWWRACSLVSAVNVSARSLVVGAIALRVIALAADPRSSDDIYRYAWEAEVLLDGASPYAFAPGASELAELRAREPELAARVAHADVPAAYPPLAQAAAVIAALAGRAVAWGNDVEPWRATIVALRLLAGLWDFAALAAVLALVRARGLPPTHALAWAWSPLAAMELSGAGHFDALGIALWSLALAGLQRRERGAAPGSHAALAAAIAVKYAPLASLPFLGRGGFRRAAGVALLAALAFAPLALLRGGLRGVLDGLTRYAGSWESTSLVFRFVESGLARAGLAHSSGLARGAVVVGLAAGVIWCWRRRLGVVDGSRVLLALALVLAPTLHPWYLTWMLPFLALRTSQGWCALIALAPLAHSVAARWQTAGEWTEPPWLWPALALPFFALLAREQIASLRR